MSENAKLDDSLRETIIANAHAIIEDDKVLNALLVAQEESRSSKIVDLRGFAMRRLEDRFQKLYSTHRKVMSTTLENITSTNQIHRSVLRILEASDFKSFLEKITSDVKEILQIDCIALVLEQTPSTIAENPNETVLKITQKGFIERYLNQEISTTADLVILRQLQSARSEIYGKQAGRIRSEACMLLDLGPSFPNGLIVIGSSDAHQLAPQQGKDLISFLAGVCERLLRRWLP